MKYILVMSLLILNNCAGTTQPSVSGASEQTDSTLNDNKVDLLTLFRVDASTTYNITEVAK